mmetsp:Transcript_43512/g.50954  ORF Transcript_43512/g.50954 Transcript_43512/m.50954 type:complete len:116 (-) Transcript_43512:97-444(-)
MSDLGGSVNRNKKEDISNMIVWDSLVSEWFFFRKKTRPANSFQLGTVLYESRYRSGKSDIRGDTHAGNESQRARLKKRSQLGRRHNINEAPGHSSQSIVKGPEQDGMRCTIQYHS